MKGTVNIVDYVTRECLRAVAETSSRGRHIVRVLNDSAATCSA
jgi:hypothetical protein